MILTNTNQDTELLFFAVNAAVKGNVIANPPFSQARKDAIASAQADYATLLANPLNETDQALCASIVQKLADSVNL